MVTERESTFVQTCDILEATWSLPHFMDGVAVDVEGQAVQCSMLCVIWAEIDPSMYQLELTSNKSRRMRQSEEKTICPNLQQQ